MAFILLARYKFEQVTRKITMNQKILQLKKSARKNLSGHFRKIIAIIFISISIVLILNMPFRSLLIQGFNILSGARITVGIAGLMVVAMVIMLINAGLAWIHLNLAGGREVRFRDVLHPFTHHPGKFIGNGLLRLGTGGICLMPALIFLLLSVDITFNDFSYTLIRPVIWYICNLSFLAGIIAYIILVMSWSFAVYMLLDHPDMGVIKAVRSSRKLVKGARRKRFLMRISFIGLLILSVFAFFTPLLWVLPYMRQSMVCFYQGL